MPDKKKEYKERAPSKQDLILIKELANGKQPREAAKIAGFSEGYINANLKQIIGKERIQRTIKAAMKAQGLDEPRLMEKLREGLDAMKAVVVNGQIQEVEDHTARRHYLKMALDLLEAFPDKAIKVTTSSNSLEELLKAVAVRSEIDITPKE
jgi:DNA-binding CsgD family transcriptional regulator